MVCSEFQAVVLAAGRGSRMTELTTSRPKCLLPLGNKPILIHALKILEKAGFTGAIVVILEAAQNEVQTVLSKHKLTLNIELVGIQSDNDWGTADSVRHLMSQEKIKSDVVLLSCDLFTSSNISDLLLTFRKHKASFSALFFSPATEMASNDPVPGCKSKYKPEKDIIGIDSETSRLVFLASASDFEEHVKISRNILRRHPKLSFRTDLIDGHIYIISYELAKFLAAETSFSTLKGEFFPYVVSKQHLRPLPSNDDTSAQSEGPKKSLFEFIAESKLEEDIHNLSPFNDHQGDLKQVYHGDILRCYAVLSNPDCFGIRINSVQAICQANRLIISQKAREEDEHNMDVRIDPTAQISSNQVDSSSFVGAECLIKEKTSIKASTLGEHCVIYPKTVVSKCILLNRVEVNESCSIENTIICDDAKIGRGCELKNCIIGAHYVVPDETKASCQVLTKSEGLMEI